MGCVNVFVRREYKQPAIMLITITAPLSASLAMAYVLPQIRPHSSQRCVRSRTCNHLEDACGVGAARDALVAQSKAHLEVLEAQRKLYLRSRALSLAQRALLYAHDELDMSMMRMQLRAAGEAVKPHEQHFRLQPFEVPLKNRVSSL